MVPPARSMHGAGFGPQEGGQHLLQDEVFDDLARGTFARSTGLG